MVSDEVSSVGVHHTVTVNDSVGLSDSVSLAADLGLPEPGWQDQWDRVLRAHTRLDAPSSATALSAAEFMASLDQVHDFFQNCYHLKDWLKNDPASKSLVSDIEAHIKATLPLALSADLANGTKHMLLTRAKADLKTRISRVTATASGGAVTDVGFVVEAKGTKHEVGQLADDAVQAWRDYLLRKGLLTA